MKRDIRLATPACRLLRAVPSRRWAWLIVGLPVLVLGSYRIEKEHAAAPVFPPVVLAIVQGSELDYSTFNHSSPRHAAQACTACHQRSGDNSITPRFPGHSACQSCHLGQFVTATVPMCSICHSDTNGQNPPLKSFPTTFKESFNVKFDHAQHMTGAARPEGSCAACHRPLNRGVALTIPGGLNAHSQCYSCHTPTSKSGSGKEIASCDVCHDQRPFARTSTNARAFRVGFAHAKHGPRQRLECASCHLPLGGVSRLSSPRAAEHLNTGGGQSCLTCHNGKRSFGGDLAFEDCHRCHTGPTFRMPM